MSLQRLAPIGVPDTQTYLLLNYSLNCADVLSLYAFSWVEGISNLYVNKEGLIVKHHMDRVSLQSST